MLRPSGRLGLALLLLAGFSVPAQKSLAQTSAPAQVSSPKTASAVAKAPVRASKPHARKHAPAPETPQTPPPPPTLEQQPPAPPQVSYQNGLLAIDSQNATLSQVLRSVQLQTGASVDIPPGSGNERVVAKLGPGTPKDVLASLLNGSKFNYVILGESNNPGRVQKIILLSKNSSAGDAVGATTAQNNLRPPSQLQPAEQPEEEYPPPDQDTDSQNQLQPGQPGMPGGEQQNPDSTNVPGQNGPGVRTPEQMLQELQRMQQQQQQLQQQLNPANQPGSPFPTPPQQQPQ